MSNLTGPADLSAPRPASWTRWWWVVVVMVLLAVLGWWATHPAELPEGEPVSVSVRPGQEVYVGVLGPQPGSRTLHVRGVEVLGDLGGTDPTPWVCRGGSVGLTTAPDRFCVAVLPADGAELRLGEGDQLMVSLVAGSTPLSLDGVQLSYREGLQWGTGRGGRPVDVQVLPAP